MALDSPQTGTRDTISIKKIITVNFLTIACMEFFIYIVSSACGLQISASIISLGHYPDS